MPKPKYGWQHQKVRAQLKPAVDRGEAYCHAIICLMPTRWIAPGTPWHVGHTPDATAYTGPEHERCNTSEGATRGNNQRAQNQGTQSHHYHHTTRTKQADHAPRSREW